MPYCAIQNISKQSYCRIDNKSPVHFFGKWLGQEIRPEGYPMNWGGLGAEDRKAQGPGGKSGGRQEKRGETRIENNCKNWTSQPWQIEKTARPAREHASENLYSSSHVIHSTFAGAPCLRCAPIKERTYIYIFCPLCSVKDSKKIELRRREFFFWALAWCQLRDIYLTSWQPLSLITGGALIFCEGRSLISYRKSMAHGRPRFVGIRGCGICKFGPGSMGGSRL